MKYPIQGMTWEEKPCRPVGHGQEYNLRPTYKIASPTFKK